MNDLVALGIFIGSTGTAAWVICAVIAYNTALDDKTAKTAARAILATPIWPIAITIFAITHGTRALKEVWADAFRKEPDADR